MVDEAVGTIAARLDGAAIRFWLDRNTAKSAGYSREGDELHSDGEDAQ
jgi:hypothetical protein